MSAAKAATSDKKFGVRAKNFFKGVWAELKKVHWPDKRQIIVYTGVVIAAVLICALVISVLDTILSFLIGLVLR